MGRAKIRMKHDYNKKRTWETFVVWDFLRLFFSFFHAVLA